MNNGLFTFLSGIDKLSAPIEQLQAGLRRLNPIKVPTSGIFSQEVGAGGHVLTRNSMVPQSYMKGRGPQVNRLGNNTVGQILLPRGGSSQVLSARDPNFRNLSGDGKRAVNVSVGLHEGFERGVRPQQAAPMKSHAAPTVLINEHNMLSRMTGPGSDEARTAMRGMRQESGEQNALRRMLVNRYGDRAAQYLEEGQKVPAAMRRNFADANHSNAMAKAHSEWEPMFNEVPDNSAVPAEWQPYLRFHQRQKIAAPQSQPQHEEFLDSHFSLNPQWKSFKKKLRSGSFLEAVRQDPRADDKLKRYSEANSRHLRARGVPTFPVMSQSGSTKDYLVKYHADLDRFSCNCGDWVHAKSHQTSKSSQDCKHIRHVRTQLKYLGRDPQSLVKQSAMGSAALKLLNDVR